MSNHLRSLELVMAVCLLVGLIAVAQAARSTTTTTTTTTTTSLIELERRFTLDGNGCSDLEWTVDLEALQITIRWKSSPNAEWTAFGISENGGMKGADIAMIKKQQTKSSNSSSGFEVQDLVSSEFALPGLDLLQHVELLHASHDVQDGRLQVTIRRDIDTCDQQDIKVQPHKQYLICASGSLSSVDGTTPLYHGRQRSTGLVNLMLDEEILFEREPQAPSKTNKTYLAPGVTVHEDLNTGVAQFVDIQMPNISVNSNIVSSYRCRVFNLTQPMKFTAYEMVWGDDGKTQSSSNETNDILHHQILFICKDPAVLSEAQQNGEVWDCDTEMPACDVAAAYNRGPRHLVIPSGIHFPLETGTFIHQVHYENPYGKPISSDQSGFRFLLEPSSNNSTNALSSQTQPAMIAFHEGMVESLDIPADPLQREITLQFLISAEATKDILPPGGVQVFAGAIHMHKLGVRGRVELIRNGNHIMDVYNTHSFDFDRQAPDFSYWRFLPGDALIISCTYKPLKDRNVHGGTRTADEMGLFYLAFAPAVPNYGYSMGVFVKEGEPFLNTHVSGENVGVHSRYLNYSHYQYQPIPKQYDSVVPLKQYRKNVCETFVRQDLIISPITYSDPAVFAQVIAFVAFAVVSFLGCQTVLTRIGVCGDLRERRNAVVYIGELIFSTVVLPFLCWELVQIYTEDDTFDTIHPHSHIVARGIMVTQNILYLLELLYRIEVRWSLVLHHLMTSLTGIYLNVVFTQNYQLLVLKFAISLSLLAVTEQPLYLVLLLRLIPRYREYLSKAWPTLCRIACAIFVATRLVVLSLMIVLLTQQSQSTDIAWRFPQTSLGHWKIHPSPVLGSSQGINAILIILMCRILFSNYFAIQAMLHMARWKPTAPELGKEANFSTEELGTVDDENNFSNVDLVIESDDSSSLSGSGSHCTRKVCPG